MIPLVPLFAQETPSVLQKLDVEVEDSIITSEELDFCLSLRGIDLYELDLEQAQLTLKILEEVLLELEERKAAGINVVPDSLKLAGGSFYKDSLTANIPRKRRGVIQRPGVPRRWWGPAHRVIIHKTVDGTETPEPEPAPEPEPDTIPKPLGIYGQQIFIDSTMFVFRNDSTAKPPDTYILGTGDEITVSIFGISQTDLRFVINEEGFIRPQNMPKIYLKGVSYGEAKVLLRERFRQGYIFLPEQFSASLTKMRDITVHIFGEVLYSGSYTIPAINTALNAIVAAGGHETNGGVRKIQLVRDGQVKFIDVYEFLLNPAVQYEYQLENNDILFVPYAEKVIHITGAINRPHRYELLPNENFRQLIDYAGGLQDKAYIQNIEVERYIDDEHLLLNVNLKSLIENDQDFELVHGDKIRINTINKSIEKTVVVTGPVETAGKYGLTKDMRISTLIRSAILQKNARTDVAYLIRKNLDKTSTVVRLALDEVLQNPGSEADLLLQNKDKLVLFDQAMFADEATVKVTGAIREKVKIEYSVDKRMTIQDLVLLGGGLETNAAPIGYLKRINPANRTDVAYLQIDLTQAMNDFDAPENLILEPNDHLMVFTRERFSEMYEVSIEGEVRDTGSFDYDDKLRIADLVYLSGGLTPYALDTGYLVRTDLENPKLVTYQKVNFKLAVALPNSSENLKLQPLDKLIVLSRPIYTDVFPVKVMGAVRHPGEVQFGKHLSIRDLITLAGGLSFEADSTHLDVYRLDMESLNKDDEIPSRHFVQTIKIDRDYNIIQDVPLDFKIQPYDHVIIRKIPGFELQRIVKIEGEVKFPGYYVITKFNERLSDVIKEAGGYTKEAYPKGATMYRTEKKKGFVVLELHKAVKSSNSHENIVLKDGDIIQIPKKEDLVYINITGTRANELFAENYESTETISLPFQGRKSAKWYINQYAGGFSKSAKRNTLTIEHINHRIKGTKQFGFFKSYPMVEKGATIKVALKPIKWVVSDDGEKVKKKIDWDQVIAKSLSATTSILGLVLLFNQINN